MVPRRLLPFLLVLLCIIPYSTNLVDSGQTVPSQFFCTGEDSPPLEINLSATEFDIYPGAVSSFPGTVLAEADGFLTLRFEGIGSARINSPLVQVIGLMNYGETVSFSVDASFPQTGRTGFRVTAEMRDEFGDLLFAERHSVYALIDAERTVIGNGGFAVLEFQAINDREADGSLTVEEAVTLRKDLASVDYTSHEAPLEPRLFTLEEQRLNESVGAPSGGHQKIQQTPAANITVQGNVQWTDENGLTHPVFGATVSIRDDDGLLGTEYITAVVTDVNGDYAAVVDDDDGFAQGDRDIFVVVRAANGWVDTQTLGGATYVMTSPTHDETPGGSLIVENFTAPNNGSGDSFSVFQGATWHAAYVVNVHGGAIPSVDIVWPNGGSGSFYDGQVKMEQEDRFDWDTIGHEYGHYVQSVLNISANPGGAHSSADCATDVRPSKDEGLKLAWGESWPTFFAISGQQELNLASLNVPRVGNDIYEDVEDGSVVYSMETIDGLVGEGTERAIMHILWDLWDTPSDNRDAISLADTDIWGAINSADPDYFSQAWNALRVGRSNAVDLLMGEIATDDGMSSALQTPVGGAIISPSNNAMSWTRGVGCSTVNDGDDFDLVFYNANTLAKILTIPGLTSPSHNLTNGEISTIVAATHDVLWAIEASNTDSPATGSYLSESRAATVNRPPVADAGDDQVVECTSYTTTAVQLDGTGSSDPDGDDLSYSWSGTGVTFDNSNSATPIGQFSMGATEVTLLVSDGIESDTDKVMITIVDTTPPVIACPADIVVECSSYMGTPKSHADLLPFFNGVSATDICDPNPGITNDAPDNFTLGETLVTFTATDASGNTSQCQAKVTVVDTTPPEITVELDRDVLWPPNHKMACVEAELTVVDICDPNPTFVLTSITSDEADNANGVGDGNTDNDIDAEFATDDVDFKLRSERQGGGDGRKYTVIYTASDMSGNSASDTVCVVVPHSQAGMGLMAATVSGANPMDEETFSILVQGDESGVLLGDKVLLGNIQGVTAPISVVYVDINFDGRQDAIVEFAAADVNAVLAKSTGRDVLSLSYRAAGEDEGVTYYLIKDISALLSIDLSTSLILGEEDAEVLDIAEQPKERRVDVVEEINMGTVEIFSVTGRRVRVLEEVNLNHLDTFQWDGMTSSGRYAPNGIYFYRIQGLKAFQPRKLVVVR